MSIISSYTNHQDVYTLVYGFHLPIVRKQNIPTSYEFLHDLREDPDELTNFAKNPKYAQTLAMLRKRTDKRVAELGGPLQPMQGGLSVSTPPHPVSAATVANRPGPDGFSKLLSGGMRGWSGDTKFWSQKDGVLTGKTDGTLKMNHFITWKVATVRNFDLRVKVRISKGGNSGIQYRSFTFVDDLVRAMVIALKKTHLSGNVFNIGNNKPVKIKRIVQYIKRYVRKI